jgi:ABC-type transporter Mla subunit MlaD
VVVGVVVVVICCFVFVVVVAMLPSPTRPLPVYKLKHVFAQVIKIKVQLIATYSSPKPRVSCKPKLK